MMYAKVEIEFELLLTQFSPHNFSAHQSKSSNGMPQRTKNGSLWQNIIQEETLMDTMNSIDVTRKRKNDRGAEAYDFPQQDEEAPKNLKRRRVAHSGNESSSSNGSTSRSSKRARKYHGKRRKFTEPQSKILPNISLDSEEFEAELAESLEEKNVELLQRVVAVLGKKATFEFFKTTQDIEREGGMLTLNRIRRRTPGGVFLYLLKESKSIDEESRKKIFSNEKKQMERKMSADQMSSAWKTADERRKSTDQMSKIPPNSPENSDYVENEHRKSTSTADPNLLSQKILNCTNEGMNGIDIDFNDDMDVF